jgi:hypothetical protein
MSACQIDAIYDAIADNISVAGTSVRNLDEINLSIRSADLPCRMLLPSTEGDFNFVAIGTLNNVTWTIRDLVLWAPLSHGIGIKEHSSAMMTFIKSYISELKDLRNPTSQSTIAGVAFQMGPVPWAEKDYWAIDITLTINEIM